jgi:hypothetical protein
MMKMISKIKVKMMMIKEMEFIKKSYLKMEKKLSFHSIFMIQKNNCIPLINQIFLINNHLFNKIKRINQFKICKPSLMKYKVMI